MLQRIVIVGAGRTAESLVPRLSTIAPVTVVDTSGRALDELNAPSSPRDVGQTPLPMAVDVATVLSRHPVAKIAADGTSRLVLEDLRGARTVQTGLVAATGDDRTNLEVCRLAAELEYVPLIGIVIDPGSAGSYEALGARTIVRATLLGDVVERALRYDGIAVASTVGLGRGDVIEVRVLPTSPFIGQALSSLDPDRWRVAAIYRKSALVIPKGETTIEADDRVLLVGDPDILPRIAEDLRLGVPDFPLRFGPNVVVLVNGPEDSSEAEAEILRRTTRARGLVRIAFPLDEPFPSVLARLAAANPGVVVTAPAARSALDRLLGRSGRNGALCDTVEAPVVFARGDTHVRRIVFVVVEGMPHLRVADAAIDLARMLDVPLEVHVIALPSYLGATDPVVEQAATGVQKRAQLHRVAVSLDRRRGNPVAEVVAHARPDDLLVVTRSRGQRDSFAAPDIALRIATGAPCSSLVITG